MFLLTVNHGQLNRITACLDQIGKDVQTANKNINKVDKTTKKSPIVVNKQGNNQTKQEQIPISPEGNKEAGLPLDDSDIEKTQPIKANVGGSCCSVFLPGATTELQKEDEQTWQKNGDIDTVVTQGKSLKLLP